MENNELFFTVNIYSVHVAMISIVLLLYHRKMTSFYGRLIKFLRRGPTSGAKTKEGQWRGCLKCNSIAALTHFNCMTRRKIQFCLLSLSLDSINCFVY